jgi:hypothetical protein
MDAGDERQARYRRYKIDSGLKNFSCFLSHETLEKIKTIAVERGITLGEVIDALIVTSDGADVEKNGTADGVSTQNTTVIAGKKIPPAPDLELVSPDIKPRRKRDDRH